MSQKEKKCVRYLACEMSKAERSVFEIELSLDDDLRAVFENFKTIWINYPSSELPERTISFEEILNQYNRPEKLKSVKVSIKKKAVLSMAFLLVFCLGPYFIGMKQSEYTNRKIASKGQRLTFILPDSSTVILNSGSEVKYSNDFREQRAIWLKGEAFFKVTKNSDSPFIVHTNDFNVKVLGTEFNINSNTINQTVSLAKGKVNIVLNESKDEINLLPNEELVWNAKTKAVIKRNFDVNKVAAWKDNILLLDDEKFEDALPKINQFYGVNFIIKDAFIANKRIKGAFKNQTIDEFITSLEFISDVSFKKTSQNNIEITRRHEN
ncbi:FecR family protein [Flavobacterium urumqiense]|uniref:FecR family protein n=1 Tax=Flavobacterium urumqiense TaxID=935224 RepID=UPI001FCA0E71|nr:FecR domain-containing protein [Flavobacterium urumqiense]